MKTKASIPPPVITDPDLVDRIFDYLLAEFPQIAGKDLEATKQAVRAEFRGERPYVSLRGPTERQKQVSEILNLFNGRNAREVARRLGISRPTVYRRLKQAGVDKSSLTFAVNETAKQLASQPTLPAPAAPTQQETTWPSPKPTLTL
jgi:hypothetical protein